MHERFKDLILEFLVLGVSFQKKQLSYYYTIILNSFLLGGHIDQVIDIQSNYQGYRSDVHFLGCHTFAVIHSVNGKGVC